jgi:drug/metabolite transporter (DMT)-like permease
MQANLYAIAAIALWASLAALGVALRHVPPFLLTGITLMVGSVLAWPMVARQPQLWRIAPSSLVLGVFTLFGFHFLLFIALRLAPAVEVNLANYLWPLFIVILSPLYLPHIRLRAVHVIAALIGFAGAAIAILGSRRAEAQSVSLGWGAALGYGLALCSGLIWANYSLQTVRRTALGKGIPTAAIGLFGLLSGLLSLLCHVALEPPVPLSLTDWTQLAVLGLGPLGGAFYRMRPAIPY